MPLTFFLRINMAKKKKYALTEGLILEIKYRRQQHRLLVVEKDGALHFQLGKKLFPSLSAAAKHVIGSDQEINGPRFWKAPAARD